MISRHGIIYKLLTVFLFAGYVTYFLPLTIRYNVQLGFFGNSVIFSSLMIVAYSLAKVLAHRDDRKYILLAIAGFLLPIFYLWSVGIGAPA